MENNNINQVPADHDLNISLGNKERIAIQISAGSSLYVLGPNGSGKSTLLYKWARHGSNRILVAGNREIIFGNSRVTLSAADADQQVQQSRTARAKNEARHERGGHNGGSWLSHLIYAVKSMEDYHNQQYVLEDQNENVTAKMQWYSTMPTKHINAAFRAASLPIKLSWTKDVELVAQKAGAKSPYGMVAMSDGERSALILSICVILAPDKSLLFIDEPERHLNRSISAPLIASLREMRPDLTWIVATHDLSLPRDDPAAKVVI